MSNNSKLNFEKLYSLTDIQKIIRENGYEDEDNNVSLKGIIDEYRGEQYTHQLYMINLILNLYLYCINQNIGSKIHISHHKENQEHYYISLDNNVYNIFKFSLREGCIYISEQLKKNRDKLSIKNSLFDSDGNLLFCSSYKGETSLPKQIKKIKISQDSLQQLKKHIKKQIQKNSYETKGKWPDKKIIILWYKENNYTVFYNKILQIFSISIIDNITDKSKRTIIKDNLRLVQNIKDKSGTIGEIIALLYEIKNNCQVKYVGDNISNGYDIESDKKCIEVKATNGVSNTFYISSNEINTLNEKGDNSYLYFIKFDNALMDYTFEIINNEQNVIIITNISGKELEYDLSQQKKINKLIKFIKEKSKSIEIYVLQNPIQKIGLNTTLLKSNGFSISIENYKISWDSKINNMHKYEL